MITLSYPGYSTPVETITLKRPNFQDSLQSTQTIAVYMTRDNTFKTTVSKSRTGRVMYATLLVWGNLCTEDRDILVAFLFNSKGEYLKYVDYNGEEWMMVRMNNDVEEVRTAKDRYSISVAVNRWQEPE